MANMTRKDALTIAIAAVQDAEALEVLNKMLEQISKPRSKSETPSKSQARLENESIARSLAEQISSGASIDGSWVMNHTIAMTPQKVVGIMKVAVELGFFERVKTGKKVEYIRL